MPEMEFIVRWPDDEVMTCYSPSLIALEYFSVGETYRVSEFVERSREALEIASTRVAEKFGHPCSLAQAQIARIVKKAAAFADAPGSGVRVEGFEPPPLRDLSAMW